jgi:hypothetical protein
MAIFVLLGFLESSTLIPITKGSSENLIFFAGLGYKALIL